MRRRRFARCILRAENAIAAGRFVDARAALEEANELAPGAAEVSALEARMAPGADVLSAPAQVVVPDDLPLATEGEGISDDVIIDGISDDVGDPVVANPEQVELDRSGPWVLTRNRRPSPFRRVALAVGQLALVGGVGYGLVQLSVTKSPSENSQTVSERTIDAPVTHAAPAAPITSAPSPEPEPARSQEPVRAATLKPPKRVILAGASGALPPPSTAPRKDSRDKRKETTEVVIRPPYRPSLRSVSRPSLTTPPAPVAPPSPHAESPTVAPLAAAEPAGTPAPEPVATTGGSVDARTDASLPPPRAAGTSAGDDASQIRTVLRRYESAYNRLDVKAVVDVWPNLDSGALDRAFKNLIAQRISLGSCEITKIGDLGVATCVGRATWQPRIGAGLQTANRYWAFNLRRKPEGWRIEQIRVR